MLVPCTPLCVSWLGRAVLLRVLLLVLRRWVIVFATKAQANIQKIDVVAQPRFTKNLMINKRSVLAMNYKIYDWCVEEGGAFKALCSCNFLL